MGVQGVLNSPLPKPVSSVLVGRCGASSFKVGVAAMNGWRPAMEDTHMIHARDTWGCFGLFDGHGGSSCSKFMASRLKQELEAGGLPADDAVVKDLMLRLDQEFLDSSSRSGSTGTFAIVERPATPGGDYSLRIGNTGDSRILLGHVDGTIFDGPGTDSGLTTDHRPDLPSERSRIERSGNIVQISPEGVPRVGGELTVSRAFGNCKYKRSPNLPLEDQAVSALPEFSRFSCKDTDFVVLICDGICEGQLSNAEVVSLAANELEEHGDAGKAAAAVCQKALSASSRDNLTCMIVLLAAGEAPGSETEFLPGSFSAPGHEGFTKAYTEAARAGGFSLGRAIEKRYDTVKQKLLEDPVQGKREELEEELDKYQGGPPSDLEHGSQERTHWFEQWVKTSQNNSDIWASIMSMSQQVRPREKTSLRSVRVPSEDILRPAVDKHSALKWEAHMAQACNTKVQVVEDDASDGTSMVRYGCGYANKAWLPTAMLVDIRGDNEPSIANIEMAGA